jgi:PilZ domain
MNNSIPDRRSTQRHELRIPLRLRIWGSSEPEHKAESVDFSESGALVETDLSLRVGSVVDLHLRLPEETTGQPATEWRCRGRVVRIVPEIPLKRPLRVGMHFDWLDRSRL